MAANGSTAAGVYGGSSSDHDFVDVEDLRIPILPGLRDQLGTNGSRAGEVNNGNGNRPAALFPLSKQVLVKAAQPMITVALVTTCTALMIAGQGLDKDTDPHVAAVMNALLFAYLPVGLFGLVLAVAVKVHTDLVGVSSGYMLVHLLIPTIIGGIVNIVRSHESPMIVVPVAAAILIGTVVTMIVVPVAAAILIGTVVTWACLCSYPKFLRRLCQQVPV